MTIEELVCGACGQPVDLDLAHWDEGTPLHPHCCPECKETVVTRTPDLLDLLGDRLPTPPEGMVLGWRSIRPDLRSKDGFRWPWPGGWAEAPDDGRDLTTNHPDKACPSETLGGLCLAKTWKGARSRGVPAHVGLVVAYRPEDVLGEDADKLRVRRCLVLDVVDVCAHIRAGHCTGANLTRADLTGAYLTGADLTGAYLTRAYLTRADLSGARLSRADLTGANLGGADLDGADLTRAYLGGADLTGADLTRAYLTGAYLTRAYLTRADLTGANLGGADLGGAYLGGADLTGADLTRADLTGANLGGADLDGADLGGADLGGAYLGGAYLDGAYRSLGDPPIPGWEVRDDRLVEA